MLSFEDAMMAPEGCCEASTCQSDDGHVLLLAEPGIGKRHQLALRIKLLVEDKKADPGHYAGQKGMSHV